MTFSLYIVLCRYAFLSDGDIITNIIIHLQHIYFSFILFFALYIYSLFSSLLFLKLISLKDWHNSNKCTCFLFPQIELFDYCMLSNLTLKSIKALVSLVCNKLISESFKLPLGCEEIFDNPPTHQ